MALLSMSYTVIVVSSLFISNSSNVFAPPYSHPIEHLTLDGEGGGVWTLKFFNSLTPSLAQRDSCQT